MTTTWWSIKRLSYERRICKFHVFLNLVQQQQRIAIEQFSSHRVVTVVCLVFPITVISCRHTTPSKPGNGSTNPVKLKHWNFIIINRVRYIWSRSKNPYHHYLNRSDTSKGTRGEIWAPNFLLRYLIGYRAYICVLCGLCTCIHNQQKIEINEKNSLWIRDIFENTEKCFHAHTMRLFYLNSKLSKLSKRS